MAPMHYESRLGLANLFRQPPTVIADILCRVDVQPAMVLDGQPYFDEPAQTKILAALKAEGLFPPKAR